ncbi:MAG: tetratricopeptide repeat protein [Rhodothermales bacterium]|nr:tetratricopeptide repeat protein [Rhodothermales bacterium]
MTRSVLTFQWSRTTAALTLIVLWASMATTDGFAQRSETLRHFDEGNEHYANGAYQNAVAAYEMALESGFASAELYYNLGNAYYRLDELGNAMLNYKRSERLAPGRTALQHSLNLTNSRLTDKFSRLPDPFWIKLSESVYSRKMILPLTLFGLLLYVIGVGLVGYRMWSSDTNAWIRRAYTIAIVVGIPLLIGGLTESYRLSHDVSGVVVVDQTELRDGPSEEEPTALQVHEGLVVRIDREEPDWTRVILPNGISGWVSAETIVII